MDSNQLRSLVGSEFIMLVCMGITGLGLQRAFKHGSSERTVPGMGTVVAWIVTGFVSFVLLLPPIVAENAARQDTTNACLWASMISAIIGAIILFEFRTAPQTASVPATIALDAVPQAVAVVDGGDGRRTLEQIVGSPNSAGTGFVP